MYVPIYAHSYSTYVHIYVHTYDDAINLLPGIKFITSKVFTEYWVIP